MKVRDLYVCCDNIVSMEDVTVHLNGEEVELNLYHHGDFKVKFFRVDEIGRVEVWV